MMSNNAICCEYCGEILFYAEDELRETERNVYLTPSGKRVYKTVNGGFVGWEAFNLAYVVCHDCGLAVHESDAWFIRGVDYSICPSCYYSGNEYRDCPDCSDTWTEEDMTEVIGGDLVCPDCIEDNYRLCDCCGRYELSSGMHTSNCGDTSVCDRCYDREYTTCADCGELIFASDATCAEGHGDICDECLVNYRQCADCGETFRLSDLIFVGCDVSLCEVCAERHAEDDGAIGEALADFRTARRQQRHRRTTARNSSPCDCVGPTAEPPTRILSYHSNTPRCFHKLDGEPSETYFGIELEVEVTRPPLSRDDAARCSLDMLNKNINGETRNHWTAMGDGSLNNGFELISQPMTAAYFDKEVAPVLVESFKKMLKLGLRSHQTSTCGLHFHVSRTEISTDTLVNMEIAIDKFQNTLTKISRRRSEHLERWASIYHICRNFTNPRNSDTARRIYEDEKEHTYYDSAHDRYHSLNFCNEDTVEFRTCRGTLKFSSFMGCFHFFRFLIDWTGRREFMQITETSEEQFILDMLAYSPKLKAYAEGRGISASTPAISDNSYTEDTEPEAA